MQVTRDIRDRIAEHLFSLVDQTQLKLVHGSDRANKLSQMTTMLKGVMDRADLRTFNKQIHYFNGMFYAPIENDDFIAIMDTLLDKMNFSDVYRFRYGMVESCKTRLKNRTLDDTNNSFVCFANGVINLDKPNLSNRDLKRHNPNTEVLYMLPYEYDSNAKCTLWLKFLDEVLPTKKLQSNLQEFLGLIFINRKRVKVETMMLLLGEGANGKSVVYETIRSILGEDNVTSFDLNELVAGAAKERNVACINGKPLNYSPDLDGKNIASESVKRIISGEGTMARNLYGDPFEATKIPLMMANTNHLPKNKDKTDAWTRRLRIIPFTVTIPTENRDLQLATKLKGELSGILNWILEGRARIMTQEYKFTHCQEIDDCLRRYKEENNNVLQYLKENEISNKSANPMDNGQVILSSDFHKAYLDWCGEVGIPKDERVSQRKFGSILSTLPKRDRFEKVRAGNGNKYRYYGSIIRF